MNSEGAVPDWILRIAYPTARRDLEDQVERVLFLSGSSGSTIDENGERTVVRLYFDSAELREKAAAMFSRQLAGIELLREETAKVDWLDYYEHSLEPLEVGRIWVIVPDRRLLPSESGRIPIVIPQERAFGTGSHESTALCLEMLESLDLVGKTVADIGTGSGILAIAMEKMGAHRIVAFDNDVETWGIVQDNMQRNEVGADRIRHFYGTVDSLRSSLLFDLAMMNIIPEVILPSLPEVARHLANGGEVIFSGILRDRSRGIVDRASTCGLRLIDHAERGEWWCARFGGRGNG